MEGSGGGGQRMIPVEQASIEQLHATQQQLDKELSFFSESLQDLKEVQAKLRATEEAVGDVAALQHGADLLVPLSESMYVRGNLVDPSKTLIDIGTGYFLEMSADKAADFFKRKQAFIENQVVSIQGILTQKSRSRGVLVEALQKKVQAAYTTESGMAASS